jgi:DNA polymerase sigma
MPESKMYAQLTEEMNTFVQWNDETCKAENRAKAIVLNLMRKQIFDMIDGIELYAFGSFSNNLCIPGGDLDLKLWFPHGKKQSTVEKNDRYYRLTTKNRWQQDIYQMLILQKWVKSGTIELVGNSKVPIVKFVAVIGAVEVPVDVSVSRIPDYTLDNHMLMKKYMSQYPAIRPMMIFFKTFLKSADLNRPYVGGLSSYPLFLMVSHFFQINEKKFARENPSLGKLLFDFLGHYGLKFNPNNDAICVKEGRVINRRNDRGDVRKDKLLIYNPFENNLNVAGSFGRSNELFRAIRSGRFMLQILLQRDDELPPNLLRKLMPSPTVERSNYWEA